MGDLSSFVWGRGDPTKWRLSKDRRMRRPPLLLYEKKRWEFWENAYRPLEEAPRLYEEFAALGKEVAEFWPTLGRLEKRGLPMTTSFGEDDWLAPTSKLPLAGYAAYIPPLHRQALRFVQDYGPLDIPTPGIHGVYLTDFFIEAAALHGTMALAGELRDADMQDTEDGLFTALDVMTESNRRLSGANPCFRLIEGRLVPSYTCDNLLTAMWLQFHEALAGGKTWQRCKGCGRSFTQTRQGQKFHDKDCRNRYHVRMYAQKSKERQEKEDTNEAQAR